MQQPSPQNEHRTKPDDVTLDISLLSDDTVCDRCASISWKRFRVDYEYKVTIKGTSLELQQSECRLCRFIGHFFWSGGLYNGFRRPDREDPEDYHTLDQKHFCTRISESSSSWMHYKPKILVTGVDSHRSSAVVQKCFPETIDIRLIKSWLRTCEGQHREACKPMLGDLRDLRVIDCKRRVVVLAPQHCLYVALSYVWGGAAVPREGSASLTTTIPPTIEDSIQITQELGCKYLWIDRYCVPQGDTPEKMAQIEQMGSIYAAAQLTLVAAFGTDPSYGLPGVSTRPRTIRCESSGSIYLYALPSRSWLNAVCGSPWAHRAWTLQEGYMSRRRLIFTVHQVVLLCNKQKFYEVEDDRLGSYPHIGWLSPQVRDHIHPMNFATECLRQYCQRKLTYQSDSLLAILGVLNSFRDHAVYHLWGVPYHCASDGSLPEQGSEIDHDTISATFDYSNAIDLLWRHSPPSERRIGFPSWSPIGWQGDYQSFYYSGIKMHNPYQRLSAMLNTSGIKVRTKSTSRPLSAFVPDMLESGTDAPQWLDLRAKTASVRLIRTLNSDYIGFDIGVGNGISLAFDTWWSVHASERENGLALKALLIETPEERFTNPMGWLLVVKSHEAYYERVGVVEIRFRDECFLDADGQCLEPETPMCKELESLYLKNPRCLLKRLSDLFVVETITLG